MMSTSEGRELQDEGSSDAAGMPAASLLAAVVDELRGRAAEGEAALVVRFGELFLADATAEFFTGRTPATVAARGRCVTHFVTGKAFAQAALHMILTASCSAAATPQNPMIVRDELLQSFPQTDLKDKRCGQLHCIACSELVLHQQTPRSRHDVRSQLNDMPSHQVADKGRGGPVACATVIASSRASLANAEITSTSPIAGSAPPHRF